MTDKEIAKSLTVKIQKSVAKTFRKAKVKRFWSKIYWSITNPISNLYYWIRCHLWNRYHILDISKHAIDYKWGWIDRDHAMYLACFHLLCEYVEQENPSVGFSKHEDYTPDGFENDDCHKKLVERQIKTEKEIRFLYDWYKVGRKEEWDSIPQTSARRGVKWMEYVEQIAKLEDKDEEMFMRLIKVRSSLWT